MTLPARLGILFIMLASGLFAAAGLAPTGESLLDRPAYPRAIPNFFDAAQAVPSILASSGVPGGTALSRGCYHPAPAFHAPPGAITLRAMFAAVRTHIPRSKLLVGRRTIVFLADGSVPPLLRTRLSPFTVAAPNLTRALNAVLSRPEVRAAARRLGLQETGELDQWSANAGRRSMYVRAKALRVPFRGGSLLDLLNLLAVQGSGAVWNFTETRCGGAPAVYSLMIWASR